MGQDGIFSTGDDTARNKWQGDYVVLQLLERAADNVVAAYESKASGPGDALYTVDMFREEFASCLGLPDNASMSRLDADVLLKYLERDRNNVVCEKEVLSV